MPELGADSRKSPALVGGALSPLCESGMCRYRPLLVLLVPDLAGQFVDATVLQQCVSGFSEVSVCLFR